MMVGNSYSICVYILILFRHLILLLNFHIFYFFRLFLNNLGTQSLMLRIRRAKGKKNWNKRISLVGDIRVNGLFNTLWHLDEYLWSSFGLKLPECKHWRTDERYKNLRLFDLSSDQILKRIQLYAYNAGLTYLMYLFICLSIYLYLK